MNPANNKESQCPLCAKANLCAMAADKNSSHCWCQSVNIQASVLASIPENAKNKSCLCKQCASQAALGSELK